VTRLVVALVSILLLSFGLASTFVQSIATPRLAPLTDRDLTDRHRALIASYVRGGVATNDIRTLLNHPDSLPGVMPFWNYIAFESTLPPRDRAILMLRTAWLSNSRYLWAKYAASPGLTAADLRQIGSPVVAGTSFDTVLMAAADDLHRRSFVGDETWDALKARYGTEQLMDAVFTVAETSMLAMTMNSLGVPVDETLGRGSQDRATFDALPAAAPPPTGDRDHPVLATPRIPPIEQTFWTGELRALLDPDGTGRDIAAVYRTFANHTALYRPRQELSEYIRLKSTLTDRARELAILRIGFLCGSAYEWAAHVRAGRAAGLTDADVARLTGGSRGWSGLDAAILDASDELFARDAVSDDTWARLSAQLDPHQLIDLLITVGGYRMASMALNTFGVPLEPNSEPMPGR
jgi:alkylhydroperoxidase family enzyme